MAEIITGERYFVAPLNSSKAFQFISKYHYSHVGFKKSKINLGVYLNENQLLVGVLQFGVSAQEGIRLDRYVKQPITTADYVELNRFCMADSEGKNSESMAISLALHWLKKYHPEIKLIVSYAGRKENNYGYIYQATNWEYLGYFVSPGFWIVDGKEKHLITLWKNYDKYANKEKVGFTDYLCSIYNDIRQTYSKQFIYIQRLDKHLTPASEILPYPKPSTDSPIVERIKVIKEGAYEVEENNVIPDCPEYHYKPNELLFTRQALIRRGELNPKSKASSILSEDTLVAKYGLDGALIDVFDTVAKATDNTYASGGIYKSIHNFKKYKEAYFRIVSKDDVPENIIVEPPLCRIEGKYYYTIRQITDEFGLSRQAVHQDKALKSATIAGKTVEWSKQYENQI